MLCSAIQFLSCYVFDFGLRLRTFMIILDLGVSVFAGWKVTDNGSGVRGWFKAGWKVAENGRPAPFDLWARI